MLPDKFKKSLKFVYSKLKDKNLSWAVVGSANMSLQGIDIIPKDLDIITTPKDLVIFEKFFKNNIIKPICKKSPNKQDYPEVYELKLDINGIEIHVFGEHGADIYKSRLKQKNIIHFNLDNLKIPCLSLKSDVSAYSELKRDKRIKLIKNFKKRFKIF